MSSPSTPPEIIPPLPVLVQPPWSLSTPGQRKRVEPGPATQIPEGGTGWSWPRSPGGTWRLSAQPGPRRRSSAGTWGGELEALRGELEDRWTPQRTAGAPGEAGRPTLAGAWAPVEPGWEGEQKDMGPNSPSADAEPFTSCFWALAVDQAGSINGSDSGIVLWNSQSR